MPVRAESRAATKPSPLTPPTQPKQGRADEAASGGSGSETGGAGSGSGGSGPGGGGGKSDTAATSMEKRVILVVVYVAIWSSHQILIKGSQDEDGRYPYNVLLMGFNIELVKLVLSLFYLFMRDEASGNVVEDLRKLVAMKELARWFAVPALIYCFANAMSFVNIGLLGVATYRVLINSRVIFSGLLLQQFFNKRLSGRQWFALGLLILGCTTEQLGSFSIENGGLFALCTMLLQAFCSSLGGVYFQWLLQRREASAAVRGAGLAEKNIFLYSWMCALNLAYIVVFEPSVLTYDKFMLNYEPAVLPVVFVGALGGFSTSLLLRYLDVVSKEYANSLEMVTVAVLSFYVFGTPVSGYMLCGLVLVLVSVYIYNTEETRLDAEREAAAAAAAAEASGGGDAGRTAAGRKAAAGPYGDGDEEEGAVLLRSIPSTPSGKR